MAKCIRCGKPCGSGENMCDECKVWFQEKTGGSVVPGVKNITSKPNKEVQADSKEQNNEQEKEKQVEVANQNIKPANVEKNNSIVISKKTLFIIIAVVAIVMIAVVVVVLKQKENNTMGVAEIENFDNNDVANEDLGSEELDVYEDTIIDDEIYDEGYDEEMTTEEVEKVSTYQYVKKDISWHEAEWEAEDAGGHLAVITSEEEYNNVCDIANESGLTYIWIGARIDSISDDWSDNGWITGEDWTFDNWYPNEPSRIDTTDNEEELYLCLWNAKYNDSEIGWTFNDQRNDIVGAFPSISGKVGYIIEFEE